MLNGTLSGYGARLAQGIVTVSFSSTTIPEAGTNSEELPFTLQTTSSTLPENCHAAVINSSFLFCPGPILGASRVTIIGSTPLLLTLAQPGVQPLAARAR